MYMTTRVFNHHIEDLFQRTTYTGIKKNLRLMTDKIEKNIGGMKRCEEFSAGQVIASLFEL